MQNYNGFEFVKMDKMVNHIDIFATMEMPTLSR